MKRRFIVTCSSGYGIDPSGRPGKSGGFAKEWLVLDRWYCHRVVYSTLTSKRRTFGSRNSIYRKEDVAREVCRRLNAGEPLSQVGQYDRKGAAA